VSEQEKLSKILYYSDMHPDNCQFIQDLIDNKDKEIERLNSIIKKYDKYAIAIAKIQDLNNSLLNDKHFREILNEEILEELKGSDKE
jgi:protein subunit release factor A